MRATPRAGRQPAPEMATSVTDPYATLGIPSGATRAEAARAHRRLAKRYHPDVNPGPDAAERMRRINEAWRTLASGGPTRAPVSTVTWTTWPEARVAPAPRARRPARPEPAAPSFGRPAHRPRGRLAGALTHVRGRGLAREHQPLRPTQSRSQNTREYTRVPVIHGSHGASRTTWNAGSGMRNDGRRNPKAPAGSNPNRP